MIKIRKSVTVLLSVLAAAVLALAVWAGISPPASVTAHADAYSYQITRYEVVMDVSADRTIGVTERITAYFTGYDSHGIIRDLTLDNGVKYRNIKAECDSEDFKPYSKNDDPSFLSVYLRGNSVVSGQTRTYTLTYTMTVPALPQADYLPLDVIGFGWQAPISDVRVTVNLPSSASYKVYSGSYGTTSNDCDVQVTDEGNVISLTAERLNYNDGITLDLRFPAGTLTTTFDFSVLYAILVGIAVVVVALLVKLLVCRQPLMTVTVNLSAPEGMDPLRMGKLIDGLVDNEDIGAAVFYLADQGYLTIDAKDESDPVLMKTDKRDTSELPPYLSVMYSGLFEGGDIVQVSSLRNQFYRTANTVKLSVPTIPEKLNDPKKEKISAVLLLGCFIALALFVFLYAKIAFSGYNYFVGLGFAAVPCIVGYIVGAFVAQRTFRLSKAKKALYGAGVFVLIAVLAVLFAYLFPCAAYGMATPIIIALAACGAGWIAGYCRCRSKAYSEILGHILGFRNFILFTEKDKIEFMLKDNPELYYHILPYAQVLGVTDEWTDKFKDLTIDPPAYMYHSADVVFNTLIWYSVFRSLNSTMSHAMVSKPSSSGGGRIGGGFGGGFGGGGFGGGGGRGC